MVRWSDLAVLLRRNAPLIGFWLATAAYYVFVISAGRFIEWHVWTATYDAQASALLRGHLHLLEAPSPELMALADPWDPANMRFWRWDHSYYQGHLYLYWGMVPAFIAAGVRTIFRVPHVGDNGLVFAFFIIRLVAGTLIIRDVARSAAHPPPRWAVALAMLVFALANPIPHTLARAAVYEAAIAGGTAFMLAGLYLASRAMTAARDGAAAAWLAGASLAFGLAAGSRLNLFPAAAALAVFAGLWRWRQGERHDGRRLAKLGAAALCPAGAVMFLHLCINQLRFDDWTEFGRRYVMTQPLLSPGLRFFLPNGYAYLFAPPQLSCAFPYVQSRWDTLQASVPSWLAPAWPADHYGAEPIAGLLIAAPFILFALAAPVLARARARRPTEAATAGTAGAARWTALFAGPGGWLPLALAIYVVGSAPLFFLKVATMRYQHDFASGLLLIAIFAAWRLLALPARADGRRALAGLYVTLAVWTIVAGVLFGFTGYFDHFKRHNPDLYHALQSGLGLCGRR